MKIIEVFANRRSGHHFFMSWLVSNITGEKDTKIKELNKITWINDKVCHYNDATYHSFFNEQKVKDELKEIIEKKPDYLIINYEESDIYNNLNSEGTLIYNNNPIKVVFIRDFLNTMASKWAVSETDLKEFYFGFKNKEQIIENIDYWKRIANNYLNENTIGFSYEDLLDDKNNKENFLNKLGLKEIIKTKDLSGTKSSFNTNNYNERFKEVNFSEDFKNICESDDELNSLIERLSYNTIENIL